MAISDEIEKLERLRNEGSLSEEEFQEAKQRALQGESSSSTLGASPDGQIYGMEPNTWCMLMHLSQLLNFAAGAGFIAPIIMWVMSKDQSLEADQHGTAITNWLISSLIYGLIAGILCFVLIGIPLLFVLAALLVIFPIVGGIKATNGELWVYPMTITFIKPPVASSESEAESVSESEKEWL